MTDLTVEKILEELAQNPDHRRAEFFRYYSNKRVMHQLKQLQMLEAVPGKKLVEIGPYLGFATGLFQAAGFQVKTVDAGNSKVFGTLAVGDHIQKNIRDLTTEDISDADILVCCEALEHLDFIDAERVLDVFRDARVPYILISVPYRCLSVEIRISKTAISSFFSWIVKFPTRQFKNFKSNANEPDGHKWELGYRGYPIERLIDSVEARGFEVVSKDYVGTVQSLFVLAKFQSHSTQVMLTTS